MLSLICAILAMFVQKFMGLRAVRAVIGKDSQCSPEMRARRYAGSRRIPTFGPTLDLLLTLLHLALLLFFVGLCIFIFNTNHSLFSSVAWLILPYSWYIPQFMILSVTFPFGLTLFRCCIRRSGKEGSKWSWARDLDILRWLERTSVDDDDALEKFFQAIPDFFDSKLVNPDKRQFPEDILNRFWKTFNGFTCRTLVSNSAAESVKSRLDIAMKAMNSIHSSRLSSEPCDIVFRSIKFLDPAPQFAKMDRDQLLTYCTSEHEHIAHYARCLVAKILASLPVSGRDDCWIQLATSTFGLTDLRDYFDHGNDSGSLAILIHLIRQSNRYRIYDWDALKAFFELDIHHTLPVLQHDFCTLWNEISEEAKSRVHSRKNNDILLEILREIRHLYISLHRGTDAAPTRFSGLLLLLLLPLPPPLPLPPFVNMLLDRMSYHIVYNSLSYPLCTIASHRSDSTAHLHIVNSNHNSYAVSINSTQPSPSRPPFHRASTFLQQAEQANIIVGSPSPSSLTITSEPRRPSYTPNVTSTPLFNPVRSSPRPANASLLGSVATAMQGVTSSAVPKPNPAPASSSPPAPPSDTAILNNPLTSCDAVFASTSNHMLPALPVVDFSIPASPPLSRVPPLPNAESLSLLGSTAPSRQTGNVVLPLLRARGLVNTGNMCFVNAVLQLLVHSPSFWNLFGEPGDLKRRRGDGGPETRVGPTPLVDATVKFFEESTLKEKDLPSTQQSSQQAVGEKSWEDEGAKKEHIAVGSFKPTYLYDAMKENKRLKRLLVRSRNQGAHLIY